MNLYQNYGRTFYPFRIKIEVAVEARCLIGGPPPVGIRPPIIKSATRFFATLGLEDGVDVSLFTTFDYESSQSPFYFFDATCGLHDQSNALIQFVVHRQTSVRDVVSKFKNELPALGLVFSSSAIDPESLTAKDLGNPEICSDHKVGGVPSFNQLVPETVAVLDLLRGGYIHLFQLTFPSNLDTLVAGNWPFAESVFHVLPRKRMEFLNLSTFGDNSVTFYSSPRLTSRLSLIPVAA